MLLRQEYDMTKMRKKLDTIADKQETIHWLGALTFGIMFGHHFGPAIIRSVG